MQTQIACPNCGTPNTADIHQIVDVGRQPQMKELLLSGQLNVSVCPNCGAGGRVATPLLYHDPAHELFMVYVPQELNLDQMKREELIGQLVQQAMDQLPAEDRRGYMLQPQSILTMQSFMEKVLETEGITPEMLQRQRKQAELLQTLATASPDVVEHLLKERSSEIDETFFALLRSQIEASSQMQQDDLLISLVNLQAKLMTETEIGRLIEKRQIVLHQLNMEVKEQEGLTQDLLLKYILANRGDEGLVDTIALAGQQALDYQFFTLLTAEVDKAEKAGNKAEATELAALRDHLLAFQEELRQASQQVLQRANDLLDTILGADDTEAAVMTNLNQIDEAFLHVLSARMAHAEQSGNTDEVASLQEIQQTIVSLSQFEAPPELDVLNTLVQAGNEEERKQILDDNPTMISADVVALTQNLREQALSAGQMELVEKLDVIIGELESAVLAA